MTTRSYSNLTEWPIWGSIRGGVETNHPATRRRSQLASINPEKIYQAFVAMIEQTNGYERSEHSGPDGKELCIESRDMGVFSCLQTKKNEIVLTIVDTEGSPVSPIFIGEFKTEWGENRQARFTLPNPFSVPMSTHHFRVITAFLMGTIEQMAK
jgi:hypothetical protein